MLANELQSRTNDSIIEGSEILSDLYLPSALPLPASGSMLGDAFGKSYIISFFSTVEELQFIQYFVPAHYDRKTLARDADRI